MSDTLTFEQVWAIYSAEGFQYGKDALENVRLGWDIAKAQSYGIEENLRQQIEMLTRCAIDNKATVTVPETMLSMARELREYAQLLDPQLSLRRMLFEAIHVLETDAQEIAELQQDILELRCKLTDALEKCDELRSEADQWREAARQYSITLESVL